MKYLVLCSLLCLSQSVSALTVAGFRQICEASPQPCEEHPILQAYVGGALDLIATLDERTDYLSPVYCKPPDELFDVPTLIQFIRETKSHQADDNAMLPVIDYLAEKGGC